MYTSKMLLVAIDENHQGTYDFLYLPIDFKVSTSYISFFIRVLWIWFCFQDELFINVCFCLQNKFNVGYAFSNTVSPSNIVALYKV